MGEKLTIQERVKLVFMFGKNEATYHSVAEEFNRTHKNLHGSLLLGHPLYRKCPFLSFNQGPHANLIRPWTFAIVCGCFQLVSSEY